MGEINLSRDEIEALKAIDSKVLYKLIDQCLYEERSLPLRDLQLERCGEFVTSCLRNYEKSLADYAKAKASKKRSETEQSVRQAGSKLTSSVQQMKERAKREEEERKLFFVDDLVIPPSRFSEDLTVRVSYQWREAVEDDWTHGTITFSHDFDTTPDCSISLPKRKPRTAKQEQERQKKLYHVWEHLMKMSVCSVKDYLRDGCNGTDIPKSFKIKTDIYSNGLNNHSTDFWR